MQLCRSEGGQGEKGRKDDGCLGYEGGKKLLIDLWIAFARCTADWTGIAREEGERKKKGPRFRRTERSP